MLRRYVAGEDLPICSSSEAPARNLAMIHFHCPLCGNTLKVPQEKAGSTVVCPRCNKGCVAPQEVPRFGSGGHASGPEACSRTGVRQREDHGPALVAAMSRRLRWEVALVAGVGALSLVLAVVAPWLPALRAFADSAAYAAMILVPSCIVLLLIILHGQATGCPSCGRWWRRRRIEDEFVQREVFDRAGVPFARAVYRTRYECRSCRHGWSTTFADEYKEFIGQQKKQKKQRLG
jgi:hypothetical protein